MGSLGAFFQLHKSELVVRYWSLLIDSAIWKTNPLGFHLTNALLHAATGLALFAYLRALLAASAAPRAPKSRTRSAAGLAGHVVARLERARGEPSLRGPSHADGSGGGGHAPQGDPGHAVPRARAVAVAAFGHAADRRRAAPARDRGRRLRRAGDVRQSPGGGLLPARSLAGSLGAAANAQPPGSAAISSSTFPPCSRWSRISRTDGAASRARWTRTRSTSRPTTRRRRSSRPAGDSSPRSPCSVSTGGCCSSRGGPRWSVSWSPPRAQRLWSCWSWRWSRSCSRFVSVAAGRWSRSGSHGSCSRRSPRST